MKKTLIAMAAVAVAGVASAQVTLSGKLSFGYSDSHSNKEASGTANANGKAGGASAPAAKDVAGFAVYDGHFTMSGSEDLGGGLTAAASMEVLSRGRDTAISGRNASLTVSGGFGSVMMGAIEAGNGIMGKGQAGAPGIGLDGKVLDAAGNIDIVKFTFPTVVEGLSLAVNMADAPGSTVGRSSGYSQGYAADLSAGAAAASIDYTDYKNQAADVAATAGAFIENDGTNTVAAYNAGDIIDGVIVQAAKAASNAKRARTRVSASYDLGVAKIGYGRQTVNYRTAGVASNVQTTMGVSVPVGAMTFGYATARSQNEGAADKTTGTDMGVKYELSKRTAIDFARATWKKNTHSEKNSYARIRLTHTF